MWIRNWDFCGCHLFNPIFIYFNLCFVAYFPVESVSERVPNLLQRCRRAETEEERQQAMNAEMIQNSIRRLMEEGVLTPADANQYNNRNRKWLDDRREFIANALMTKHVIVRKNNSFSEERSNHHPNPSTTKKATYSVRRTKSDLVLPERPKHGDDADDALSMSSDDDDDKYPTCAICLVEYQDGDEICWAANKHCNHVFHKACITQWLLRHEECPCCRTHFLSFHDDDEEEDVEEDVPPATNRSFHSFHSRGGNSHHSAMSRGRQLLHILTLQRSRHEPSPVNLSLHLPSNNGNISAHSETRPQRSNHPPPLPPTIPIGEAHAQAQVAVSLGSNDLPRDNAHVETSHSENLVRNDS